MGITFERSLVLPVLTVRLIFCASICVPALNPALSKIDYFDLHLTQVLEMM